MKVTEIKTNPNNPRIISEVKLEKLKKSIKEFPRMLELRPLVLDENNMVLGGNMRLKALQELGIEEVSVLYAKDLTEEQKKEFIIKDNLSYGEWDWDILTNDWDPTRLGNWGLEVGKISVDIDYSVIDDVNLNDELNDMANGVKRAILLEFEYEHYKEAYALMKFWRERKAYIGGMFMKYLKDEKEKL